MSSATQVQIVPLKASAATLPSGDSLEVTERLALMGIGGAGGLVVGLAGAPVSAAPCSTCMLTSALPSIGTCPTGGAFGPCFGVGAPWKPPAPWLAADSGGKSSIFVAFGGGPPGARRCTTAFGGGGGGVLVLGRCCPHTDFGTGTTPGAATRRFIPHFGPGCAFDATEACGGVRDFFFRGTPASAVLRATSTSRSLSLTVAAMTDAISVVSRSRFFCCCCCCASIFTSSFALSWLTVPGLSVITEGCALDATSDPTCGSTSIFAEVAIDCS